MSDEDQPTEDQVLPLSANQLVAWRLHRARMVKGWTQEEAASHLAPFLGEEWSKATYSAAERSAHRYDRIRQFSADDLVAFAAAFEVPVQFFFVPDIAWHGTIKHRLVAGDPESSHRFDIGEYLRVVYGSRDANAELQEELTLTMDETAGQWDDVESQAIRSALTVFAKARLQATSDDLSKMSQSMWEVESFLNRLAEAMEETTPSEMASIVDGQAATADQEAEEPQVGEPQSDETR